LLVEDRAFLGVASVPGAGEPPEDEEEGDADDGGEGGDGDYYCVVDHGWIRGGGWVDVRGEGVERMKWAVGCLGVVRGSLGYCRRCASVDVDRGVCIVDVDRAVSLGGEGRERSSCMSTG
jgi:hypothetical protein